jgi:putative membrane protein
MSALVYSLNATLPLFLIIMLGYGLQRCHWFTKDFATACDKLVFHVTLPVTLFLNMASVDIRSDFHFPFVVFCFVSSLLSILGIWLLTKMFLKDKTLTGEFIQAGYRSSAAILGSALIQNLYGSSSYAPMMILGTFGCYIMAKNMGHEGVLTSSAVAVTTPLSAVTLTLWMFLLRTLHLVV